MHQQSVATHPYDGSKAYMKVKKSKNKKLNLTTLIMVSITDNGVDGRKRCIVVCMHPDHDSPPYTHPPLAKVVPSVGTLPGVPSPLVLS